MVSEDVEIAAVVVHWNSLDALPACLRALSGTPGLQPVVVDNASPDGGEASVRGEFPGTVWVSMRRNAGFGAGINAGARSVGGRWVLVLNPDTVIEGREVRELARWADGHGAAAVAPLLRGPDGTLERSWDTRDSAFGDLLRRFAYRLRWSPRPPREPIRAAWLTGACLLVRRDVFDAVGGFDESYFLYFEDVDLGRRIRARGERLVLHPGFEARHRRGGSAEGSETRAVAAYRCSELRYVTRHRPKWQRALARWNAERLAARWESGTGGGEAHEAAASLRAVLAEPDSRA